MVFSNTATQHAPKQWVYMLSACDGKLGAEHAPAWDLVLLRTELFIAINLYQRLREVQQKMSAEGDSAQHL
jgi:uncharacterized membrane protein